jgi:hypothetical protein
MGTNINTFTIELANSIPIYVNWLSNDPNGDRAASSILKNVDYEPDHKQVQRL